MIKLIDINPYRKDVYWVYQPDNNDGCYSDYLLKALSEKLYQLNKPWNDQINGYFNGAANRKEI